MAPPGKRDLVRYREVRRADQLDDQKTALQILAADASSVTQEELQQFLLSQVKRIIWGDHAGTWKDDFVAAGVSPLFELTLGRSFYADCLVTDVVGASVIITGPPVLSIFQVTTVDIKTTGLTKVAIGILTEKLTPTRCVVTLYGEVDVSPATLVPGKVCWVGVTGQPTTSLPVPDPGGKIACHAIGTALAVGRMLVNPERRPTIRTS